MAIHSVLLLLSLLLHHALAQGLDKRMRQSAATNITTVSVLHTRPADTGALIQHLRPLISASRAEPGNSGYHMFANPNKPGVIGLVERYVDEEALSSHLASEHVTSAFNTEYFEELETRNPQLFGPWTKVPANPPKNEELEMVFYYTMSCGIQHLWDVMSNITDASWVFGNPTTTIVPLKEDGTAATDEEAKEMGPVDPGDGLGPVVQRLTFPDGMVVDLRFVSKDNVKFSMQFDILTDLVYPSATLENIRSTLSLDSKGLDADIESRARYHMLARIKKGTSEEARKALNDNYYGGHIPYYRKSFNCTGPLFMKRAETNLAKIYAAMVESPSTRISLLQPLFARGNDADMYVERALREDADKEDFDVMVKPAYPPFSTPDLRITIVEDIVVTSLFKVYIRPRIVVYQFDKWGRVLSMRIYDKRADEADTALQKKLVMKMRQYFHILATRDIEQVRKLYANNAQLEEPVSFEPPKTFDTVYSKLFGRAESFAISTTPESVFLDEESRQVAQLLDIKFQLVDGGEVTENPVQIFTFTKGQTMKISAYESFFKPANE